MRRSLRHAWQGAIRVTLVGVALLASTARAQSDCDAQPTSPASLEFHDALGNAYEMSPESVPESFAPGATARHVPGQRRGKKVSDKRLELLRGGGGAECAWFSAKQPGLAPYLSSLDEYGNTAVQPGALIADDPVSAAAQRLKYALSNRGFYYLLAQGFGYVSLTHVPRSEQTLGYYSFDFFFKQLVLHELSSGTATWLSGELYGDAGLGAAARRANPQSVLQSVTAPAASMWGFHGLGVAELAWQQSFADRRVVALLGVLDQTNYLDTNAYANFSLGQFQNSAFVNSQVLPTTAGNLGLDLQWQPSRDWYTVLGVGPNNATPKTSPFDELSGDDMSYILEVGYVPDQVARLGPGAYRLQPFVATVDGVTQAGIGLNFDQQLGAQSPLGFFGRFGIGGAMVTRVNGARAQIATGIVLARPLAVAGLARDGSSDLLGLAFAWSQPSAAVNPRAHENEYAVELIYSVQITPTVALTPDVQLIANPAGNAGIDESLVFQLPLIATW